MNMRIVAMACLLFAGCGPKGDEQAHPKADVTAKAAHAEKATPAEKTGHAAPAGKTAKAEHVASADKAAPAGAGLKLNDGRKWALDDHTRQSLATLQAKVKAGPATDDVAGHHALGKALDDGLQALIRGCTMKGPDHDMLHVWLMAFIPAVGSLGSGEDLTQLRAERTRVAGLLEDAHAHFE